MKSKEMNSISRKKRRKDELKKTRTRKNTECTGFCALITKIAEQTNSKLKNKNNILYFQTN
jgi:type IV secretory pathway VirB6-like protein